MSETLDQMFRRLRSEADLAEDALRNAVREACANHRPVQHRDRKPPWCGACGRDWAGFNWRAIPPRAPSTAPLAPDHPAADHPDGSGAGGASEGEGGK